MTVVAQMTIPPEFEALLKKILAYFDTLIYPTWASRMFHTTRSAKKANKEKTYIPGARVIWNSYTPAQKTAWLNARGYTIFQGEALTEKILWSGYNTFIADYCYRRKNGLTLPGTPYTTHQLYGLKMSNPGGACDTYLRFHLKDLVGPITIDFYYKKTELQATFGDPFNVIADAFFFDGGLNIVDEETWEAPAGNVGWTHAQIVVGEAGKKYFHLILQFSILDYDTDVFLDNFKVTTNTGIFSADCFSQKAGKSWDYQAFYRKQGWTFYPSFAVPSFEVVYLDS